MVGFAAESEKLPQLPAGAQLQVTTVLVLPETKAVNCAEAPAFSEDGGLEIETVMGAG